MKTLTFLKSILITVLLFTLTAVGFGADGDVDPDFIASAARARESNFIDLAIETSLKQPDGKILVGGNFQSIGEYARLGIARLNADGSVDATFNPPDFGFHRYSLGNEASNSFIRSAKIYSIALQPDGKILVGGDFTVVNGANKNYIVRLNSDGSLDTAFNMNLPDQWTFAFGDNHIKSIEVQPDGKILLSGPFCFSAPSNGGRCQLARLNPDGTNDTSFQSQGMFLYYIKLLPDGKILNFGQNGFLRLNSDGSVDPTFTSSPHNVEEAIILPNNQIIVVGAFTEFHGFNAPRIARLNADGTFDTGFNPGVGANNSIKDVYYTSDGKLLVAGVFTTFNNFFRAKVARLNFDGSTDLSFDFSGGSEVNTGFVNEVTEFDNGNLLVGGGGGFWDRIYITNSDGLIFQNGAPIIAKSGLVNTVAKQADGKVLAGGRFIKAGGITRYNIVRFNTDGTIDTSFVPDSIISWLIIVKKIYPLADGKILVGVEGERGLFRLNANGSLDNTFNPQINNTSDVRDFQVQSDGKIIAIGRIQFSSGGIQHQLVRLSQNGAFEFSLALTDGIVLSTKLQTDGKILIGGSFNQVNGIARGKIALVNPDGSVDTTFNPPGGANGNVTDIAVQPDGKIVIVGEFTSVNGSSSQRMVGRLNPDGSLDTSFNQSVNYYLYAVKLQPDGKILIGGGMTSVGGQPINGLARLNVNGSVDNTFQTGTGTNGFVYDIDLQADNKILFSGDFTKYNGFSKLSIGRLENNLTPSVVRTRYDFDGDGRADIGVFRPSSSIWYQLLGPNYQFSSANFGTSGDLVAPADFDGDGKTDLGIFRPSTGTFWYAASSAGGAFRAVQWGQSGDVPLPADVNGDGRDDYVVYRPSNNTWYRLTDTGEFSTLVFGLAEDKPVIGDFDGDGKADYADFPTVNGNVVVCGEFAGQCVSRRSVGTKRRCARFRRITTATDGRTRRFIARQAESGIS